MPQEMTAEGNWLVVWKLVLKTKCECLLVFNNDRRGKNGHRYVGPRRFFVIGIPIQAHVTDGGWLLNGRMGVPHAAAGGVSLCLSIRHVENYFVFFAVLFIRLLVPRRPCFTHWKMPESEAWPKFITVAGFLLLQVPCASRCLMRIGWGLLH